MTTYTGTKFSRSKFSVYSKDLDSCMHGTVLLYKVNLSIKGPCSILVLTTVLYFSYRFYTKTDVKNYKGPTISIEIRIENSYILPTRFLKFLCDYHLSLRRC